MARFVSHPLGVDLRRVFITFEPASILMTANVRRFTGGAQNGNVGSSPTCRQSSSTSTRSRIFVSLSEFMVVPFQGQRLTSMQLVDPSLQTCAFSRTPLLYCQPHHLLALASRRVALHSYETLRLPHLDGWRTNPRPRGKCQELSRIGIRSRRERRRFRCHPNRDRRPKVPGANNPRTRAP